MKKKPIIITLTILVIAILTIFFIPKHETAPIGSEETPSLPINYTPNEENTTNQTQEDQEKIQQIVQEQGLQANTNIYEIAKEHDGREAITIKQSLKYQVALAGTIKKSKPEYNELQEILKQGPQHTGIWIPQNSREKILELLKQIAKATYEINEQGYLTQQQKLLTNKYDQKIKQMLTDQTLYIFDINSTTYTIDEVTGEIQEYPFEQMDPYTPYEYFENENQKLYLISQNTQGKTNQQETLQQILE